jgi:hypothetical protein
VDRREAALLMRGAAYLYPWDVAGDPAAAELFADLGLGHAVLAAVYHGTRAVTPRHPAHRIVTAEHTAAYHPVDPALWRGAALVPPAAPWCGAGDGFGRAAGALHAAGVPVHGWLVVNHVDLPGAVPQNVVNAYGDRYPWALCAARDEVHDYAVRLATGVARQPGIEGLEIEACGWFGFDHLGAHDKAGGVPLDATGRYLMSLCFCAACRRSYVDAGLDPAELRTLVRAALDAIYQSPSSGSSGGSSGCGPALAPELFAAVTRVRRSVADGLRADVLAAVRAERPGLPLLLHVNPDPTRAGAFTGAEPATAAAMADGLVVNCWRDFDPLPPAVRGGGPVYASLLAVEGLGGRPAELPALIAHAEAAGAAGYRLYHAGLAARADLDALRALR